MNPYPPRRPRQVRPLAPSAPGAPTALGEGEEAVISRSDAVFPEKRDLESAWNRHVDTGGDFFDIESQYAALATIIECYRKVGDATKADRRQDDFDRWQKKATRRAL